MRENYLRSATKTLMIVLFALPLTALKGEKTKLTGTVADSEGAAIRNAFVVVRPDLAESADSNEPEMHTLRSGKDGQFESTLDPGFYDVCVMATAFTPECRKIRVADGPQAVLKFRLSASKVVLKQLGDTFDR